MQEKQIIDDEIDINQLIIELLKGWKIVVSITFFVILITFIYLKNIPNQYHVITQAASIGTGGNTNKMVGLAALAGLSATSVGSNVNLLDYVEDVVKNGDFLDRILYYPQDTLLKIDTINNEVDTTKIPQPLLERVWALSNKKDSIKLSKYFKIEIDSTKYTKEKYDFYLRRALYSQLRSKKKQILTIIFNDGLLTIETKFTDPQLSFDFHQQVLKQLKDYFKNDYTIKDKAKRIFIEARVNEVADSLRISENKLTRYLNVYPSLIAPEGEQKYVAPKVLMEYGRRKRIVTQYTVMYTELLKQYEMAKIDEKKEQPVFEVVRKSELPLYTRDPNRKLLLVIGFILGGVLGIFVVFARKWILWLREEK